MIRLITGTSAQPAPSKKTLVHVPAEHRAEDLLVPVDTASTVAVRDHSGVAVIEHDPYERIHAMAHATAAVSETNDSKVPARRGMPDTWFLPYWAATVFLLVTIGCVIAAAVGIHYSIDAMYLAVPTVFTMNAIWIISLVTWKTYSMGKQRS